MRFGLLTIHAAVNFGSALQAAAFLEYMQKLCPGDRVELIDYRPTVIMDPYSVHIGKNLGGAKQVIRYLLSWRERKERNRVFEGFFDRYFVLSDGVYCEERELEEASFQWDAVFLGSDQIWNPQIVGYGTAFFLSFCRNAFRASFAGSFGTTDIPEAYVKELVSELKNFEMISVREPSAKVLLKEMEDYGEKEIAVVSDPVFLLSEEEWTEIEKRPKQIPKEYIVFYTVQRNPALEDILKKIGNRYRLPVIDLGLRTRKSDYLGQHSASYGPEEFVYLIHHAQLIFTNSFHGTAFGTIFRKKCISMLHRERGTRIKELAELSDRTAYIVSEQITVNELQNILSKKLDSDYSKLDQRIAQSKEFLTEAVRRAHEQYRGAK